MSPKILYLSVALAFASLPCAAAGSAPTLTFLDSDHPAIPLNPALPVAVTAEGKVEATCLFQQANPRLCQGLGTGINAGIPTVALTTNATLVAGSTTIYAVTSGQSFSVTRTLAGGAADVCLPTATNLAQVTGWASPGTATSTASVVIGAQPGAFMLGLRCYNGAGAAQISQLLFQVAAPVGPDPFACSLRDQGNTDPLLQPSNFTRHVRSWPQVFNGFTFPSTPSFAMPVGSFTVTGNPATSPPSAGMYLSIPVTLAANHALQILSTLATGTQQIGYNVSRPGNVFISLSPCAGDLRPTNASALDIFARSCRGSLGEGVIAFSTKPGVGSCSVPAGDYWINIMHANPAQAGFGPTSESCNPLETQDPSASCESNISVSYIPI